MLEDDADIRELIGLYLRRESLEPILFDSPARFVTWMDEQKVPPHLLILDLMMPELSGTEIIAAVRKRPAFDAMPIVVCSAKSAESDVILTLGLGADTYLRKPFNPRELVAQVSALLRRSEAATAIAHHARRVVGNLVVDSARKLATVDGKPADLTPNEFCILAALVRGRGSVLSREELLNAMGETDAVDRVVDVHIAAIRRKLGTAGHLVQTSRGFGYYIDEEET